MQHSTPRRPSAPQRHARQLLRPRRRSSRSGRRATSHRAHRAALADPRADWSAKSRPQPAEQAPRRLLPKPGQELAKDASGSRFHPARTGGSRPSCASCSAEGTRRDRRQTGHDRDPDGLPLFGVEPLRRHRSSSPVPRYGAPGQPTVRGMLGACASIRSRASADGSSNCRTIHPGSSQFPAICPVPLSSRRRPVCIAPPAARLSRRSLSEDGCS